MALLASSKSIVREAARGLRVGTFLPLGPTIRLYGSTDKGEHGYVPFYVHHLGRRRFQRLRILEIGVGGYASSKPGGSLRVWRDYFLRSTIVGLDINAKNVELGRRVSFIQGDQTCKADLDRVIAALGGPPNVVIDDGSHFVGHASFSFEHLFPLMPAGATYVVEDLHTSYWETFGGAARPPANSGVGLVHFLVEAVQAGDPTFSDRRWRGNTTPPKAELGVASVDVRPGIAFIYKK